MFVARFLQVAAESEHCIIKREHEKCMEMMAMHTPVDTDYGKCMCVLHSLGANPLLFKVFYCCD